MEHLPHSGRQRESERFSVSSDASDGSVDEILRDAAPPFVPPVPTPSSGRPVHLSNPTRLQVQWGRDYTCFNFKPTDTFAHVKRSLALHYSLGLSWLTIDNWDDSGHIVRRGSRCFRDVDETSTLQDAFIGCQAEPFKKADAGSVLRSSHGPLRISTSEGNQYLAITLFGCDRVCEVKRRIEGHEGIAVEYQRILFDGRELADDFILDDLGEHAEESANYTIMRLVVRLPDPIRISIQHRNGERFGLEIESSDLILEVKKRIESETGIGITQQRLFLGGKEMADRDFVCDWSVQSGFTLHFVCVRASENADGETSDAGQADGQTAEIPGRGGEDESMELSIHDLESNTLSSIVVGRRERLGDVWARFGYDPELRGFWLGNLSIHWSKTLDDYAIRNGTIIHFKFRWVIWVKMFDARHLLFDVAPTDTIMKLKRAIQDREGIPRCEVYLVFDGKPLEDERTIEHYSIRTDSTVRMGLRLRM